MTRTTSVLGAIALLGIVAAPSFAAGSVTVTSNNTSQEVASGYTNTVTSGADMAGITVKVTYVGGAMTTYTYAATGPQSGSAGGGGFALSATGPDTFFATGPKATPFTLTNAGTGVTNILVDAFPGHSVFDRTDPSPGTAGSLGADFQVLSGLGNYNIVATYSGEVAVPPAGPVGDVYRFLDINFGTANPFTGPALTFAADTDNVQFPGVSTVPEPAPLTIVGVGVLMMAGLIVRKRRSLKA